MNLPADSADTQTASRSVWSARSLLPLSLGHKHSTAAPSWPRLTHLAQFVCLFAPWFFLCSSLAQEKTTYQDQVLPLIEANCSKCHNPDKKKADLDLTSYQGVLKGSGSGLVVVSGNLEGSKLWKALTHAEDPTMPPNRPKLADKELDVFKKWIVGGLLETADGKPVVAANPGVDLTLKPEALEKPEGPPPMPVDLPCEPVVHTLHGNAITGLAASPWAPLIAVAGQKQVLLFHSETLELLGVLPFTEGQPADLKFSHSGKLLLAAGGRGARSGRVMLWDVTIGEHLTTLGDDYDTVLAADIRPDQSQVALGGPSRLVKIFSTKTGELLHKIKKHTDWVTAVAFSPNGQVLATADRNGGISLWDPESGEELFTLAGHKSYVTALSWRADSKLLASSSEDGTVKLWDAKEGKQIKSWTAHGSGTLCVSYSSDGRLVTCGRDNAVTLWDVNGSKKRSFDFFGNLPLRAAFSCDGKRLFATDFTGRVAAWNDADGKRVGELNPDPLPLAQQLAAARKHLSEIATNTPSAETNSDPALAETQAEVKKLEAGQLLAEAWRLRETIAARKIEQEKVSALIQANTQALQEAQKELAAAKDSASKTQARTKSKSAKAEVARNQPLLKRLSAELKADELRLDQLLQKYHTATAVAVLSHSS
jgi:WD40 repeat protein